MEFLKLRSLIGMTLFAACTSAFAQTADRIVDKFRGAAGDVYSADGRRMGPLFRGTSGNSAAGVLTKIHGAIVYLDLKALDIGDEIDHSKLVPKATSNSPSILFESSDCTGPASFTPLADYQIGASRSVVLLFGSPAQLTLFVSNNPRLVPGSFKSEFISQQCRPNEVGWANGYPVNFSVVLNEAFPTPYVVK